MYLTMLEREAACNAETAREEAYLADLENLSDQFNNCFDCYMGECDSCYDDLPDFNDLDFGQYQEDIRCADLI